MKHFENKTFIRGDFADRDTGAIYEGFEFRKCRFEQYYISLTAIPSLRSTVRNIKLIDCSEVGCKLYCPIVEDVLVEGLKTGGQLLQTWGAAFNRVVIRGKLDRIMISNDVFPSANSAERERVTALFRLANADFYRNVEWALDISEGEFKELEIRGVPTHLIRRDSKTQVIVTRERALQGNLEDLALKETLWKTWIYRFLESDEASTVLVAPKRHPKFRTFLDDLRLLQEAGIAEAG